MLPSSLSSLLDAQNAHKTQTISGQEIAWTFEVMLRYEHQGIRVASKATVQPRLHNKTFMEELSRLKKKSYAF